MVSRHVVEEQRGFTRKKSHNGYMKLGEIFFPAQNIWSQRAPEDIMCAELRRPKPIKLIITLTKIQLQQFSSYYHIGYNNVAAILLVSEK